MTSSTLVWNPETLARTACRTNAREPREGWDKPLEPFALCGALGKRSPTAHEEYSAATRERGDPMLPKWMVPNGAASL